MRRAPRCCSTRTRTRKSFPGVRLCVDRSQLVSLVRAPPGLPAEGQVKFIRRFPQYALLLLLEQPDAGAATAVPYPQFPPDAQPARRRQRGPPTPDLITL